MRFFVVGVYQDVVKIYDNSIVKEVMKNVINKMLECSGSICEAKGHNLPFKGSISGVDSSFPFITFSNSDQMVGMSEINFSVNLGLTWCIEKVSSQWKRVSILVGDFVKSSIVNTKSEGAILLFTEKDRGSKWR